MHKKRIKDLIPAIFIIALIALWGPSANASIVVEGDRQFTDDVNECLSTYRDVPGIVGDAIKELENSENEHKILNSPDWSNTSNNLNEATGGSGSGTVTRVDKDALEQYKEDFEELKDKDFCTALLHELWHALDADGGTRTSHSDKVDGVKRNEIEATIFQNFVHAIRGVDPRTSYGNRDISSHVLAGDSAQESQEKSATEKPKEENQAVVSTSMSFSHVKPGQYSEIYMDITGEPGANVSITLSGPSADAIENPSTSGTIEGGGKLRLTWKIYSYGAYSASGTVGGEKIKESVNVK